MPEAAVQAAVADLCASYQEAVVEALSRKTRRGPGAGAPIAAWGFPAGLPTIGGCGRR